MENVFARLVCPAQQKGGLYRSAAELEGWQEDNLIRF